MLKIFETSLLEIIFAWDPIVGSLYICKNYTTVLA